MCLFFVWPKLLFAWHFNYIKIEIYKLDLCWQLLTENDVLAFPRKIDSKLITQNLKRIFNYKIDDRPESGLDQNVDFVR